MGPVTILFVVFWHRGNIFKGKGDIKCMLISNTLKPWLVDIGNNMHDTLCTI